MSKIKTIAFYLPQYHAIPENDEWWGKGFTEWTTLKKAKPLFDGHYQPRIPLNNNYYSLLDSSVQEWQSKIAMENGIYGFCYYHYWFNGHLLLEKPAENMLRNKNIKIKFCFSWANENWTKAWEGKSNSVLIAQTYGDEKEWREHFQYFLPFFKDKRYILDDNRPFFIIYRPELIKNVDKMMKLWNELAVESGFKGMCFAFQHPSYKASNIYDENLFDYEIEYQPTFSNTTIGKNVSTFKKIKRRIGLLLERVFHIDIRYVSHRKLVKKDYDTVWEKILNTKKSSPKSIAGAFVDWDNTPRRGDWGTVYLGSTPVKFKSYFTKQLINIKENYETDYLFVFAWNEWTEGGYLEPDEKYQFSYLQALKEALIITNNFEKETN